MGSFAQLLVEHGGHRLLPNVYRSPAGRDPRRYPALRAHLYQRKGLRARRQHQSRGACPTEPEAQRGAEVITTMRTTREQLNVGRVTFTRRFVVAVIGLALMGTIASAQTNDAQKMRRAPTLSPVAYRGAPKDVKQFTVNGVDVILRPADKSNHVIAAKLFI